MIFFEKFLMLRKSKMWWVIWRFLSQKRHFRDHKVPTQLSSADPVKYSSCRQLTTIHWFRSKAILKYVVADGANYYQHVFTPDMHIDLKNRLSKIKGKFLLSYDDVPTIREQYKDFNIKKTKPVRYTLNQKSQYKQELFITNY